MPHSKIGRRTLEEDVLAGMDVMICGKKVVRKDDDGQTRPSVLFEEAADGTLRKNFRSALSDHSKSCLNRAGGPE